MILYATTLTVATMVMVIIVVGGFAGGSMFSTKVELGGLRVDSHPENETGSEVNQPILVSLDQATSQPELDPELVKKGQTLFVKSCVMCHGPAGKGVTNLGNDLTVSTWMKTADLDAVAKVIREGRAADAKDNTSGRPMPAKGGVPSLNDGQIKALSNYCKSIAK